MKYKKFVYMCIAIILVAFLLYRFVGNPLQYNKTTIDSQKQNTLITQTNSEGTVTIKVTPENISEDKKTWNFRIVLDTHTGSLDEDLTKNAVLIDDQAERLKPEAWEGDPPGGHHREGLLTFGPFSNDSKSITLILQNVGGVFERKFTWESR
ncbi:MAG TPA: hypothetical protein PKA38_05325 [Candidatus Levybacteria bacterium]|jgi:hypothetical protein|nr:hypothetical protein [Candidatus Levybacteria bacterium]